jgi:hypothetical protein
MASSTFLTIERNASKSASLTGPKALSPDWIAFNTACPSG